MNLRLSPFSPVFLAAWLFASPAPAQWMDAARWQTGFATPAEAAGALGAADPLQARVDLLRKVAATYLQAHAYESLPAMIAALPVPETAAWQRTFLLADLQAMLGSAEEARRSLKQLPEAGLRDPAVIGFRIVHPDLFGDDPLQPSPGLDAGTPEQAAKNYLDTLEPDQAWRVIAAHPEIFLDDLGALHRLTRQIADQNLAPRFLPLLAERARRQPENWELSLTLAGFQLLAGDTSGATETFRQVYARKSDGSSPAPTPAERVAALQGIGPHGWRQWDGALASSQVKTLETARDLALVQLARLADERGEGAKFIGDLEAEYRGDRLGWITALMLIDSPGLVIRELRATLVKGPPPGLDALAAPWLKASHVGQMGTDWSQEERNRLAAEFARVRPAASPTPPGPGAPTGGNPGGNFVYPKELSRLNELSQGGDDGAKEAFLAELTASPAEAIADQFILREFLYRRATRPDDAFLTRGAAILLAKAAADADGAVALRAFGTAGAWQPLRPAMYGGMGRRLPDRPRPDRSFGEPPPPSPVNEQVEALFLGQCTPTFLPFRAPTTPPFPPSSAAPPPRLALPSLSGLAPALEKLAGDASSPLHVSARIAVGYLLHDIAGQEDHALDLLRQSIKESPSYAARFWLTAFLARRQQYREAAEVFDGIKPVPGHFEEFLLRGREILRRADQGEPLPASERPAQPFVPTARPATTVAGLVANLRRLLDAKAGDSEAPAQALAIAAKLGAIYPPEDTFPDREIVLKTLARFGGLEPEIARITASTQAFPRSADALLALGEALALSTPSDASTAAATAALRKAFQLAPERADIAERITGPGFSVREREDACCVLLRQDATRYRDGKPDMTGLFKEPDAVVRRLRAYAAGFRHGSRGAISGNPNFRDWVASLRKAGQDDAVIEMLTTIDHAEPVDSDYDAEPEKLLLDMLVEKGCPAEAVAVVDRMLFPSEYLYGLDTGESETMPLLNPPQAYTFIRKVGAPEGMATLEGHARRVMAEHPGGTRAPLVLLTLLLMEHSPTATAELPGCVDALRSTRSERLAQDFSTLARIAASAPETRSAAFDLLAEARRRQAGTAAEAATVELLATTALDLGDCERAEGALREILAAAKARQKPPGIEGWTHLLELMARSGMEADAAEFFALVYGPAEGDPRRDRRATSSYVLAYMAACVRYGQPEMGRKALADFQRLLVSDVTDLGDHEQVRYKFDENFLRQMVETCVSLDRAEAAARALQTLQASKMAAAAPELRRRIETAQALLARGTGGAGALPVAFLEPGHGRELALWWDVSAMEAGDRSRRQPEVSVFGVDLKALDGRYSVEILGGDAPNHLARLAVIPHAPSRGEWHGTTEASPATIRFTRVILTDTDGSTIIGPAVPADPGEERLADPEMRGIVGTRTSPAQWTLPEGVLSSSAGPIPGHPALTFAGTGIQTAWEFRGARIPVGPGESFVQSAWLRSAQGCRWGVRCFDAQGKELTEANRTDISAPYELPGWTRVEQRLQTARDDPAHASEDRRTSLPAGTAFLEPVLTVSSNVIEWEARPPVSWAGLSLRSVPPARDEPATLPERVPDQLGPMETPAPAGESDQKSTARNETVFADFGQFACKFAVSPEGDQVVVGCQDGTLHFLDYPSGKEVAAVHAHDDPILDLAVLPGKAGVYSVDTRGDTHFVVPKTGQDDLVAWTAHKPSGAVLSPARKWVIFASDETRDEPPQDKIRIEVVDLATGRQVRLFDLAGLFNHLSLSPDEKQFSVRQAGGVPGNQGPGYLTSTWELPTFNKLPDRAETTGWMGASGNPLFAPDPARSRYVMVEGSGRFVVRTMDNEILWAFNPAPEAVSLAVVPTDGAILVGRADGKIWRCVSPK